MEETEARGESQQETSAATAKPSIRPVSNGTASGTAPVRPANEQCPTCAAGAATTPPSYVYALGKIEPRFPRLSVEKEFAQVVKQAETVNLNEHHVLRNALEANRYLVRQLCWVMTVGGLETYIVVPRDPTDFHLLVESLRPSPRPGDIDLVVGVRGPMAPPEMCNGLLVPVVVFDQTYSFDRDSILAAVSTTNKADEERFKASAGEVFDRIMQLTDNAGATDDHRALNYLAVRYSAIYAAVAEAQARNLSLTAVDVRPSALSGVRKIVEVIFSFTNRTTDVVEKQFVRVDVTEEFPFLVTKLSPYFDR